MITAGLYINVWSPPIRTEVLYCARYPQNSTKQQWVRVLFSDTSYSYLIEATLFSEVG